MTKKLIAAAAAMLMLTACGAKNTDTDNAPAPESTDSISETSNETEAETSSETEAETSSETEADTSGETEAETSNETEAETSSETEAETSGETEAATEADNSSSSSVYDGKYYTINVDLEKWTNANDMRQAAGEVAESLDNGLDMSAEQYAEMCDAIFNYNDIPEGSFGANFNIVTQDIGVEMDMDTDVFGPAMEDSYKGVEGYEFLGWEGVTVNGNDCLVTSISAEQMGIKMKMKQYIFLKGGKQTVITLTAAEDLFDSAFPDFEKAVNTVTLK